MNKQIRCAPQSLAVEGGCLENWLGLSFARGGLIWAVLTCILRMSLSIVGFAGHGCHQRSVGRKRIVRMRLADVAIMDVVYVGVIVGRDYHGSRRNSRPWLLRRPRRHLKAGFLRACRFRRAPKDLGVERDRDFHDKLQISLAIVLESCR